MKIYLYKQKWQICQGDQYFWLYCCVSLYISYGLIHVPAYSFWILSSVLIGLFCYVLVWFRLRNSDRLVEFSRKNNYMNMKYSYLTTMYESIFTWMYTILVEKHFLQFLLKIVFMVKSKQCKKYQKYIYLGKNTFIHCSRITVVHVHNNTIFIWNSPSMRQWRKRNQSKK